MLTRVMGQVDQIVLQTQLPGVTTPSYLFYKSYPPSIQLFHTKIGK